MATSIRVQGDVDCLEAFIGGTVAGAAWVSVPPPGAP
jgi:hypothetical protein